MVTATRRRPCWLDPRGCLDVRAVSGPNQGSRWLHCQGRDRSQNHAGHRQLVASVRTTFPSRRVRQSYDHCGSGLQVDEGGRSRSRPVTGTARFVWPVCQVQRPSDLQTVQGSVPDAAVAQTAYLEVGSQSQGVIGVDRLRRTAGLVGGDGLASSIVVSR